MKRNKEVKDISLYIPAIIVKDKRLSATNKYLLTLIISLDQDEGCYASNSYLAERLSCSLGTISRSIKYLQGLGYIIFNQPNIKRGGRGYIRHVREDLKYKKAAKSIKHSSPSKKVDEISQNALHIYKGKENYLKNENVSIEKENELVQKELEIPIPNKDSFYKSCKSEYNELYSIEWNKEQIESLIKLCNKLYQSFKSGIDLKEEELSKYLSEIFYLVITHRPTFFTDSLPHTFVRFWNKVIQQPKLERSLSRIKMRNCKNGEGF